MPISSGFVNRVRGAAGTRSPREPIILTVSRIARSDLSKGHFAIARSLPVVLKPQPAAQWMVVGAGDSLERLKAETHRLGIGRAVTFAGRITDSELASMYEHAALFVLPSVTDADARPPVGEGFGIVFAEAGAFGVPSIASASRGGSAEFVTDGVTGLTVPPNDTAAFTTSILTLLRDQSLRMRLGQNARERALGSHLPSHFPEQIEKLFAG